MKRRSLLWAVVPAGVGVGFGLLISSTDLTPSILLGCVGLVVGWVGGGVVSAVHTGFKVDVKKTSVAGFVGSLLGIVVGGYVGVSSDFGSWMLATFNPDLPEMDFKKTFGFIGGVFIGAVLGATAMAGLVTLFHRTHTVEPGRK